MIFTRDSYINQLIQKKQNGMIKIVTGLRRCGKSFLLFKLFYEKLISDGTPDSHIIKIPLDDLEYSELREKISLYKFIKSKITDNDQYYCLLDEIQLVEGFGEVLNSLLHIQNLDVYVTGSNSRFLVKDVITEFRGRGDEVHMYPLTFSEFMSVYKGERSEGWRDYVLFGGIPLVLGIETADQKSDFLKSLFEETYISDITGRNNIRNSVHCY